MIRQQRVQISTFAAWDKKLPLPICESELQIQNILNVFCELPTWQQRALVISTSARREGGQGVYLVPGPWGTGSWRDAGCHPTAHSTAWAASGSLSMGVEVQVSMGIVVQV